MSANHPKKAKIVDFPPLSNKNNVTQDVEMIQITKQRSASKSSEISQNFKTNNRFEYLNQDEDKDRENKTKNTTTKKKKKISPIVITGALREHKKFTSQIKEILKSDNFRLITMLENEEDKQMLTKAFKKINVSYHTFTLYDDKAKKVVVKAAPNMDINEIKDELIEQGIRVRNCTKLNGKNPNSFSYLVTTERKGNIG